MRKKICGAGIFLFLLLGIWSVVAQAAADPSIQLWINGNKAKPEVPPQLVNGRTLVPVYTVQEGLGAKVGWDAKSRRVTVTDGNKEVQLTIGSKTARVNGKAKTLDIAPVIIGNRTFLPFRAVGELLGAEVGWEEKTKSVMVNDPVRFQLDGQAISAKAYRQGDSYFVTVKQIASASGYMVTKQNSQVVLVKEKESKTIPSSAYKNIDGEVAVSLSFIKDIVGGSGSWNEDKSVYTMTRQAVSPKPTVPQVVKVTDVRLMDDVVEIKTDSKADVNDFTMDGPSRIVVDVKNAHLALSSSHATVQGANTAVRDVRYSQFASDTVRVVVELAGSAKYDLTKESSGIKIQLKDITYPESKVPVSPAPSNEPPAATDPEADTDIPVVTPGDTVPTEPDPVLPAVPLSSKQKVRIVVDAGHGGKDTGATGNGLLEKNLTLGIASRLADDLRTDGKFDVLMTREGDTYPTLQDRVILANSKNADLFISVHINSGPSTAHGTETYYRNANSQSYATIIHKHLLEATGFADRKVKTANYYVIKNTKMPAILMEIGFISNSNEAQQMAQADFQQRVADAVYAGIKEYVQKN
jgi:N-acetylmuramoyl-L-alanine amidase